jgi:hypothetical protein
MLGQLLHFEDEPLRPTLLGCLSNAIRVDTSNKYQHQTLPRPSKLHQEVDEWKTYATQLRQESQPTET